MSESYYKRRVRVSSSQIHPLMELHGRRFHCNGEFLSLDRKPLASRIVTAFMQERELSVSKGTLVNIMTKGSHEGAVRRTEQYEWTRGQSLNRLMSRLRLEFEKKFQAVVCPGIHWFHFDSQADQWLLYKLPGEGANGKLYA
ncbi:MAG: hypothetical protein NTV34_09750 [Proteobacteria bacterium]|nr:hypothetical protein [Pseudomonadota bacterium]